MANEMLTGLLNQTSGGNWWQGSGAPTSGSSAPTSGYGSFTPTPPPSQQTAPETSTASADPTGQPPATAALNPEQLWYQQQISQTNQAIMRIQNQINSNPNAPNVPGLRAQITALQSQLQFNQNAYASSGQVGGAQ